jgi:hypothetical protein
MKLAIRLAFAALSIGLTGPGHAAVTLTEWGTLASVSSYTCASDFCGDDVLDPVLLATTLTILDVDGQDGQTSAMTGVGGSYPTPGSASGMATVSSGLGLPILKAGAASQASTWIAGQALAIQAYEYTGLGETISLTWTLTGSINNPDSDPLTGLSVFARLFRATDLGAFPVIDETDQETTVATAFLLGSLALISSEDNFQEFTTTIGGGGGPDPIIGTDTVSLEVVTGEEFYLAMGLMAGAGGVNATSQSLSTLVGDFDQPYAVAPAFAAVPVPGAVWLLGSAVIGLVGVRRRV